MERIEVKIKNIIIGNGQKVAVQSMTNTLTVDTIATINQINKLEKAGCDIVRISIPDIESAISLKTIISSVNIPIVGDIHYDHNLAIAALESGVHKIRINPSNFPMNALAEVVAAAKGNGVPIRVGVNQGSMHAKVNPDALADYALHNVLILEKLGFYNIVVSAKSSDILCTIEANRILKKKIPYPLHVGLTEAGQGKYAEIKSIYALSVLLSENIGDTIRISLTGPPEREVKLAKYLLRASGLEKKYFEVISCPTCARTQIDVENIARQIEEKFDFSDKNIKVSVMGCIVNGIGEAKNANIAICGGKNRSCLYINGIKKKVINNSDILAVLLEEIENYEG